MGSRLLTGRAGAGGAATAVEAELSPLQLLLRRDHAVAIVCLSLAITLSWAYILAGPGMDMVGPGASGSMAGMMMARPAWDAGYAALMLLMWWIMMVAMMLPSAAPMILLYMLLNRRVADGAAGPVMAFALAYVVVWGGFSAIATALQWGLEKAGLLSAMMATTHRVLGGALLIAAGLWQLTPLKHACLRYCRAPIHVFAQGWRSGAGGAFRMGLAHGAFCVGCCWVLMALLFFGGVMNLWWIAGLAAYVLIEKLAPAGHWIGRGAGVLLLLWGLVVLAPAP